MFQKKKIWIEVNDDKHGNYNRNSQIKLNIKILNSSLYEYSHAYVLVKETIQLLKQEHVQQEQS